MTWSRLSTCPSHWLLTNDPYAADAAQQQPKEEAEGEQDEDMEPDDDLDQDQEEDDDQEDSKEPTTGLEGDDGDAKGQGSYELASEANTAATIGSGSLPRCAVLLVKPSSHASRAATSWPARQMQRPPLALSPFPGGCWLCCCCLARWALFMSPSSSH